MTIALLATVWVAVTANRQVGADTSEAVVAVQVPARPAGMDRVSRSAHRTRAFATVEGLELALPHPKPLLIGFHEASRAEALAMAPRGRLAANENATRFTPPPDVKGHDYLILSSRGRARPPTSAVDVVVPLGDAVAAPVSGTVTAVTEYPLYNRVRDWRVEITPAGREDLTVVLIHLLKPNVKVGDAVTAGQTPVGVARLLPFDSHVDYALEAKQPHTHIEVKPAVAAVPIDPNQPATPAEVEATPGD